MGWNSSAHNPEKSHSFARVGARARDRRSFSVGSSSARGRALQIYGPPCDPSHQRGQSAMDPLVIVDDTICIDFTCRGRGCFRDGRRPMPRGRWSSATRRSGTSAESPGSARRCWGFLFLFAEFLSDSPDQPGGSARSGASEIAAESIPSSFSRSSRPSRHPSGVGRRRPRACCWRILAGGRIAKSTRSIPASTTYLFNTALASCVSAHRAISSIAHRGYGYGRHCTADRARRRSSGRTRK
jgi:hypothetical protein